MLLQQLNPCLSCTTSLSTFIVWNTKSTQHRGISVKLKTCPNASHFIHLSDWKLIQWNVHYLLPILVNISYALAFGFTQSSHLAQQIHLMLGTASWEQGSDVHTSQWTRENCQACWENRKNGGHKFNSSTLCCVTQWIPPLIISSICITNKEALSVYVHIMCKQLFHLNQKWKLWFPNVWWFTILCYSRNEG